jgi:hypothetical protein
MLQSIVEMYLLMIGAIMGAVGTGVANLFVDYRRRKSESECVTQAIVAEISAHLEIIRKRNFHDTLINQISLARENKQGLHKYYAVISRDHSPVYFGNTDKLGLLNNEIRLNVVKFYQLLECVICDIQKNEGYLAINGGSQSDYEELLRIVEEATKVGEQIVSHR